MRYTFFSLIILIGLVSCTDAPDFDTEPELIYEGVMGDTLAQSIPIDTVLLQFTIRDADGDIGDDGSNRPTLFLIEEMDGDEFTYILPGLSEQGSGKGIEAEASVLFIRFIDLCCRYPNGVRNCEPSAQFPVDSFFYEGFVRDHAGHESNHVRVGPIYLRCD